MASRKKKSLLDQASDFIDEVRPQVESAVVSAIDAAEDFYENTARPALVDAKEKAGPALADAREKAAPYVAQAAEKASELAAQAKEAADAKVETLRGQEETTKKKGGKLKKVAIFAAIAGVIGFVARKLQKSGQGDNWQSSYVPTPAPAPAATPATGAGDETGDDAGAAGPDEAISDAAETPHAVSTPDDPAEIVDLEAQADAAPKKK
jgi:hypothetical protein